MLSALHCSQLKAAANRATDVPLIPDGLVPQPPPEVRDGRRLPAIRARSERVGPQRNLTALDTVIQQPHEPAGGEVIAEQKRVCQRDTLTAPRGFHREMRMPQS